MSSVVLLGYSRSIQLPSSVVKVQQNSYWLLSSYLIPRPISEEIFRMTILGT